MARIGAERTEYRWLISIAEIHQAQNVLTSGETVEDNVGAMGIKFAAIVSFGS
jgi:hypothetical protein